MIIIIIVIIECLGCVRPWVLWRSTELELSLERFLNPGGLITYKDIYLQYLSRGFKRGTNKGVCVCVNKIYRA